ALIDYDTIKHAIRWTQPREIDRILAATPAALYVLTTEGELVRALDPKTGSEVASYGISNTDLLYTASDHRAPMFVVCDRTTMTPFDPTGRTVPPEHARITGTFVCPNCKQQLPEIDVAIGDVHARTDKHGGFALDITARGALQLKFDLPAIEAPG